ncbi:1-phosphofructokinase family hexose kinase [Catenulispora subtropica]|uniref:1-phosphofructokinase n=1 Tax=Catenulispora subtropica TaxID=450798 RepID=A0ABN2T2N0_9ACTN
MIVTLTLNPSLDRTLELRRLRRGAVNRAVSVHLDPGGKGVNVTRALRAFGVASRAVIPCGGADGRETVRLLEEAGIPVIAVPVGGRTRSNVTLVEGGGTSTKINEPGSPLTAGELAAVGEAMLRACGSEDGAGETTGTGTGTATGTATGTEAAEATRASWAVLCGSLPPGVPDGVYARLTELFAGHGFRVAVDTSGSALVAAVPAGPDLIKPNREELAGAVGRPLAKVSDVVAAAEELRERGAGAVLASLGPDGAVLVDRDGARYCRADPVEPRSTVGAGDAMLAGFLAAQAAGASGEDALIEAVSWGRAAVGLPGSRMPGPKDVSREGVRVVRDPENRPGGQLLSAYDT